MTRISANLRMTATGISFQTLFLDSDHTCSSFCQGTFTISGSEILSINLFGLIFENFKGKRSELKTRLLSDFPPKPFEPIFLPYTIFPTISDVLELIAFNRI